MKIRFRNILGIKEDKVPLKKKRLFWLQCKKWRVSPETLPDWVVVRMQRLPEDQGGGRGDNSTSSHQILIVAC